MSLARLREKFPVQCLAVDGEAVEYVRTGGALPAVLWLPGAQGTAEVFHRQLLAAADRFDGVSIGTPGWTDPVALADFVARLADALGLAAFHVVGSSYGGYLAQWIALRHPQRVRRVVVGNSFGDATPLQGADKLAALDAKSPAALKAEVLARLQAAPDGEPKDTLLDLVGRHQSNELLHQRMRAVQLAPPLPPLPIADERLLILDCDDDPLIPPPVRAALRERHPLARHVALPRGGHYPFLAAAEPYDAAVFDFLATGGAA